jgi:hypothetical protein
MLSFCGAAFFIGASGGVDMVGEFALAIVAVVSWQYSVAMRPTVPAQIKFCNPVGMYKWFATSCILASFWCITDGWVDLEFLDQFFLGSENLLDLFSELFVGSRELLYTGGELRYNIPIGGCRKC